MVQKHDVSLNEIMEIGHSFIFKAAFVNISKRPLKKNI